MVVLLRPEMLALRAFPGVEVVVVGEAGSPEALRAVMRVAREHVEEAVVGKEARVVEEIGLRSESESHVETISDTVRKTEVEIEDTRTGETTRVTGDGMSGTSGSDRDRI